jgi:aspartyl-tRNA synthetase
VVQVVIRDEDVAHNLRAEYCLKVTGEVCLRPEGNQNPALPTGEVEVVASDVEVLSAAAALPFPIDEHVEVGEEVRLKYRYLDLRRPGPAAALRLRSDVNRAAREVLASEGFVEIETPTLTRSTPEGARDFLVPARLQPGSWYALPQSPQLFKQLLMVAGMERYFQIARCYRDEDFRADRQPEFTQLDVEMSFVEQDDVIAVAEDVLTAVWSLIGHQIPTPIQRMSYAEAMRRYGTDKPDLRMGLELVECTDYFSDTPFRVFQAPYVGAVVMPGGGSQPRKQLDAWQEWAKQRGAKGLAYVLVGENGELGGPVAKNLSDVERQGLAAHVGASPGDCVFFAAGPVKASRGLLGAARLEIGRRCQLVDEAAWSFLWVVDAPLFEPADEATAAGDVAVGSGAWTAVHHAFTSPKPESLDSFDTDPGSALAYAYDIVCNGNEIGGGSIRIHREDVQRRVFAVMGLSEEEAAEKFGFLLDALKYGAPPHGGIAFGWDRICALLSGTDSIRDVIAFPKTGAGYDPLTGAPAPITADQRKEAGVDTRPRA